MAPPLLDALGAPYVFNIGHLNDLRLLATSFTRTECLLHPELIADQRRAAKDMTV